jgi:Family of unknown function (DUF5317)
LLFVGAILIGLVFGLLTGGRLENVARLRFRWPWVLVAAVVVREVILLTPLGRFDGARFVYVAALIVILAWTVDHWPRVRGVWLVSAGIALNLVVIIVNGERMPVARELAGSLLRNGGTVGQYTVMGDTTRLNLLADWISLRPSPEAYSVGDVLIALGLAIVIFSAARNPRPYREKELTPP